MSYLADALAAWGHEITLFKRCDVLKAARSGPCAKQPTGHRRSAEGAAAGDEVLVDYVRTQVRDFDILHFHATRCPAFRIPSFAVPTLMTLHGCDCGADLPDQEASHQAMPLVSVCDYQRDLFAGAKFVATIYHGLPETLYRPTFRPRGGYLAFCGRIAPENRVEQAILIADSCGVPLKIAGKADGSDQDYFNEVIRPLLRTCDAEFISDIEEGATGGFLGEALALIFPSDWLKPFGLIAIEAMACGTPVLAFGDDSTAEIVEDGVTGAIITSMSAAPRALGRVVRLDRRMVRQRFERRFSAARMASDYLRVYGTLLSRRSQAVTRKRLAAQGTTSAGPA